MYLREHPKPYGQMWGKVECILGDRNPKMYLLQIPFEKCICKATWEVFNGCLLFKNIWRKAFVFPQYNIISPSFLHCRPCRIQVL